MPIMEDEHGTYIMNSKDLRGIEVVEKTRQNRRGQPQSRGRTKSLYYVARVAQSYRKAIDDAVAGRPFDYSLLSELEALPTAATPAASSSATKLRIIKTT